MIEAIGITKRFGSLTALDGLSTRVPEGGIYGLVGPNGSGKSTLLRLMAGVYRPDAGQLLLAKLFLANGSVCSLSGLLYYRCLQAMTCQIPKQNQTLLPGLHQCPR